MLFDMALSGRGRSLKLIHFGGGHEHLCILQRLPSKSGNLSLQFLWFSSNLIHNERYCCCPSAFPGAHLRMAQVLALSQSCEPSPPLSAFRSGSHLSPYACPCSVLASASGAPQTSSDIGQALTGLPDALPLGWR